MHWVAVWGWVRATKRDPLPPLTIAINFGHHVAIKSTLDWLGLLKTGHLCGRNYKLVFHQNSLHFFFSLSSERDCQPVRYFLFLFFFKSAWHLNQALLSLTSPVINFRFVFVGFLALTCRVKGCLPASRLLIFPRHNIIYLTCRRTNFVACDMVSIAATLVFLRIIHQLFCDFCRSGALVGFIYFNKLLSTSRCANKFRMLLLAIRLCCYSFSSCLRCSYQRRFLFIYETGLRTPIGSWHKTALRT